MTTATDAAQDPLVAVAAAFLRDGYAILRDAIAPAELAALRANSAELLLRGLPADAPHPSDWFVDPAPDGRPQLHRVQFVFAKQPIDDAFLTLLGHPRLLALVRRLLGERFLCTGEALVAKLPGDGREVPLHADCDVGDPRLSDAHRFFNLDIYLDDSTPDNGCLLAAPGTHRDRGWPRRDGQRGLAWEALVPVPVRAGDVIVHDTRVAHGSRRSTAPALRRTLYLEFHRLDDIVAENGPRPGLGAPTTWIADRARLIEAAIARRARKPWAAAERPFAYRLASELGVAPVGADDALELRPSLGLPPWF